MISIVCVYNSEKILNDYLLKNLKNQTVNFELIDLDNSEGKFKSAAEALNYGGEKAKGKYIMFVHQDVDLSSNSWLEEVEKMLDELPNLGIAGVAGKKDERGVMSVIKNGNPPENAGSITIENPEEVQTLDECLIIVPKSVFDVLQFDEEVCDDWHLYAVDYSLSVKKIDFDAYAIPMFIYHRSAGYLFSGKYYLTLKKVLKKHKKDCKQIYMTMGDWGTLYPLTLQKIWRLAKAGVKILFKIKKIGKTQE
ncbi:MAG: hypothetical protein KAT65_17750 [Methanophagales archaeon]|nr:hypothetical protein [Methanophagales archaeon]